MIISPWNVFLLVQSVLTLRKYNIQTDIYTWSVAKSKFEETFKILLITFFYNSQKLSDFVTLRHFYDCQHYEDTYFITSEVIEGHLLKFR